MRYRKLGVQAHNVKAMYVEFNILNLIILERIDYH